MRTSIQAGVIVALCGVAMAAQAAATFATVISSTPVTASVPVSRQVCSDGQQVVQQAPSGVGAVIGAIAGGVIGHNLGDGFGRAAATGIGAVAGSVIGNQVEANATPATEVPVRRCQNVSSVENRIVGYDVMYEYAGQRYSTRLARDPGRQLAVNVQPAESSPATGPMPVPVPANVDSPAAAPPQTTYYQSVPQAYYYQPVAPIVYVAPLIGFGWGYYGGYYGGHSGRHWH